MILPYTHCMYPSLLEYYMQPLQTRVNTAAAFSVLQSLPIGMSSVSAALTPMSALTRPADVL
jgi:hypothetical protein